MKIHFKVQNVNRSTRFLLAMTSLCLGMTLVRLLMQQDLHFTFLVFNLLLAWVPFLIANSLFRKYRLNSIRGKFVFIAWLIFFPNSPYIVTDLLHLKNYTQSIMWFDSLLIFVYALTGLLLGAYSLNIAHKTLNAKLGTWYARIVLTAIIFLSSFGIYLGRYCRLNSWDMFHRPIWFIGRVMHQFENPLTYKVTIVLGLVFLASYAVFINFRHEDVKE